MALAIAAWWSLVPRAVGQPLSEAPTQSEPSVSGASLLATDAPVPLTGLTGHLAGEGLHASAAKALSGEASAPPARADGGTSAIAWLDRAALESAYRAPPLADAKRAFDRGDAHGALALLKHEDPSLPVRMLRARALARAGADRQAAETYAGLAVDVPLIASVCAYEAARGFERSDAFARSAAHYALVPPDSERFVAAREGLSRVSERLRDLPRAIAAAASLTDPATVSDAGVRARAWLRVAELSRRSGSLADERSALWALWAREPGRPEAARARARLGKRSPVPARWALLRAESLVAGGVSKEAIELAEALVERTATSDEERCRARIVLGAALRRDRREAEALVALEPAVGLCTGTGERLRALELTARARLALDGPDAVSAVEALSREAPRSLLTLRVQHLRAAALSRTGRFTEAAELFARVVEADPSGSLAAEALFQRFWALRRAGDPGGDAAREALDQLLALPDGTATLVQRHQARYWRARALEAAGRADEALGAYETLARDGVNTSYGLFARERLMVAGWPVEDLGQLAEPGAPSSGTAGGGVARDRPPSDPSDVWPLALGSLAEDPRFWSALELVRLEHPMGPLELLLVDRRRHGPEGLRVLFHVFEALGRPGEARLMARSLVREWDPPPPTVEARRLLAIAYPPAYGALVSDAARRAGVDPALLQALVREESQFNPRARSGVGARGLAQVMPATGAEVARGIGLRLRGPDSLFEPALNLRLGASYLAKLLRRVDGATPLAVASYNAGPNAVARWLNERPLVELDAWLEDIPIEETRTYVRRVLGSYGLYALGSEPSRRPTQVLGLATDSRVAVAEAGPRVDGAVAVAVIGPRVAAEVLAAPGRRAGGRSVQAPPVARRDRTRGEPRLAASRSHRVR